MSKVGKRWTTQENEKLTKLYTVDMLDINEIAKIHERNPLGIAARLVTLKLISHILDARGHPNPELVSLRDRIISITPRIDEECLECLKIQQEMMAIIKIKDAENLKLQQEITVLNIRIFSLIAITPIDAVL